MDKQPYTWQIVIYHDEDTGLPQYGIILTHVPDTGKEELVCNSCIPDFMDENHIQGLSGQAEYLGPIPTSTAFCN